MENTVAKVTGKGVTFDSLVIFIDTLSSGLTGC